MDDTTAAERRAAASDDSLRLSLEDLRWTCDESWLPFASTADLEPLTGIVGQDDAMDALRFGLEINAPGQNIFVRGLVGTGRMSLLQQLLRQIRPACPLAEDRCYVHNFDQPDRPRLITLPRGRGTAFGKRIDTLIEFIQEDLGPSLSSDAMRARRNSLDERAQEQMRDVGKPFEEELAANDLALVPIRTGQTVQPAILPIVDGKPLMPDKFKQLRSEGAISKEEAERIHEKIKAFGKRLQEIAEKTQDLHAQHRAEMQEIQEKEARAILSRHVSGIQEQFPQEGVKRFLSEFVDDLVGRRLRGLEKGTGFARQYRVNVILPHDPSEGCPFIIEHVPTLENLLGSTERQFLPDGRVHADHSMIRAGSLLRADGGYLILDARDLLGEPGAWKILLRTLRTGKLQIAPPESRTPWGGPFLKPEPIDINVKVILLGDPGLYGLLDAFEPEFPHLFKVLADFDTTIARDERGVQFYGGVLARVAREEGLLPFSSAAVGALAERGARIAGQRDRLTTRFGRLADIAREAAFLTTREGGSQVGAEAVHEAVALSRRRADLPARTFRRLVAEQRIRIQVQGVEVGQINGLAVIHAGPLTYGFPTRITATIGPGTAGAINIEREAELSGAIHTKGFYILGGLLRHLLRTDHPLAFSASIAFEQTYGGIDGDSASGAEMCCLLSALIGAPLRQDLSMTGAIDQRGHMQAVGAVAEKIEGFFETCRDLGLTGTQGVLIPRANVGDLMLRPDVVEACGQGRFHVYGAGTIQEALQILTGRTVGIPDEQGHYPEGTLLYVAEQKAREYWRMAATNVPRDGARDASSSTQAS